MSTNQDFKEQSLDTEPTTPEQMRLLGEMGMLQAQYRFSRLKAERKVLELYTDYKAGIATRGTAASGKPRRQK